MNINVDQQARFNEDLLVIFEAVKEATIVFGLFSDQETFASAFKPGAESNNEVSEVFC